MRGKILIVLLILLKFSFLSENVHMSNEKPVLPEELKIIETLPRRESGELNIEINKIKSEPVPALLNREKKLVTLDFSKYQNMKNVGANRAVSPEIDLDFQNRYYIFLANSLQELPNTSGEGGQKIFNEALRDMRSGKGNFKIVESKKIENPSSMLELTYEVKPEEIYLALIEKATGKLTRVFRGEIEEEIEDNLPISIDKIFNISYSSIPDLISFPSQIPTPVKDITRMYINVSQNSDNPNLFPIVGINRPEKWNLGGKELMGPLNPIDAKPELYFYLDFETSENANKTGFYPAKINIEQTTIQSPNKFFVYTRGGLGESNLAVGAYGSEDGTGNKVEVTFTLDIPLNTWSVMRDYTDFKCGSNTTSCAVNIPYNNGDIYAPSGNGINHNINDNNIYITYGKLTRNDGVDKFAVPDLKNVKVVPFPQIKVTKASDYKTNIISLNIRNPIPKSDGTLENGKVKGSFSLLNDGGVQPFEISVHPKTNAFINERLEADISGYKPAPNWTGYRSYEKIADEVVKIEVWANNRKIKEVLTDIKGDFSSQNNIEEIALEGITLVFKGEKNNPSLGIKNWDLERKEINLELRHLVGEVTKDQTHL